MSTRSIVPTTRRRIRKMKKLMRFIRGEEGVVMIEYALIAALIGVALVAVLILLRTEIGDIFNFIIGALTNAQT
jgi:Flp pilus assembly pilin Flp